MVEIEGGGSFAFGGREIVVSAAVSTMRLLGEFEVREAQTRWTGRKIRKRDSEAAEKEQMILFMPLGLNSAITNWLRYLNGLGSNVRGANSSTI